MSESTLSPKQQFTLSLELVNGVANYLGTRPHNEVDGLVRRLREEVQPQLTPQQVSQVSQPEAKSNEEKVAKA